MLVHARYPVGEPRVEREAKAARDAGRDVEVVCLREPGEPRREVVDGIRVRRLPVRHRRGVGFALTLLEYVWFAALATVALGARRRAPAVVHVHTPPDFLAVAALPLRLRGATVLLDVHDLSPHMYEARFRPGPAMRAVVGALRAIERAACAVADRVITVHEPYRRELVADGVDPDKVTVVMNSADERLIERVRQAVDRDGERPAEQGFVAAYHGTITHWYGVDLLVDAIARASERVPGLRGVVLGDGDALDAARARAAELRVDDRVWFSGAYAPIEETLRRVAAAGCGVVPNRASTLNRFALSSKLFEYVALGVPAAVARLDTLAAHFSDDEVTFFEPDDADSLAEAIAWIASNPEAAREKAARARERAREYSWRQNADRYVRLLDGGPPCAG
jgi:glycosyltransferase involved in cell wall biosynthesis